MATDELPETEPEDAWSKEYRKIMKGEKEKETRDRLAIIDFKLSKVEFFFC